MELAGKWTESLSRNRFWAVAILLYLALIYSTGLHYAYGPESTVDVAYFTTPKNITKHRASMWHLDAFFPDHGLLRDVPLETGGPNFWKLGASWGDSAYYLLQSRSLGLSVPPFKYRVLPSALAGLLSRLSGWTPAASFVALNVAAVLAAALLFTAFLRRRPGFPPLVALLGGALFLTMVASTRTLPFPLVDPLSLLLMLLGFIAAVERRAVLFLVASILGVLTKETLLILAPLWVVNGAYPRPGRAAALLRNVLLASLPVALWSLVRVRLGGAPLEVSYGFDLLRGQVPPWFMGKLFQLDSLLEVCGGIFLSFSFLWLGLGNVRRADFLWRSSIVVPVLVVPSVVFTGTLARSLGILFPIVITGFLFFLVPRQAAPAGDRADSPSRAAGG